MWAQFTGIHATRLYSFFWSNQWIHVIVSNVNILLSSNKTIDNFIVVKTSMESDDANIFPVDDALVIIAFYQSNE